MTDTTSSNALFTITFWQATLARIINGAAIGAITGWTTAGVGGEPGPNGVSIPWWGILIGSAAGGLWAFLQAMIGGAIPASVRGPTQAYQAPGEVFEIRRRPADDETPPADPPAKRTPAKAKPDDEQLP